MLQFEELQITVPFKQTEHTFNIWQRSLWEWGLDHLRDKNIVKECVFDAQRLWKYNQGAESWERFITEPYTANRFWNIQVRSFLF